MRRRYFAANNYLKRQSNKRVSTDTGRLNSIRRSDHNNAWRKTRPKRRRVRPRWAPKWRLVSYELRINRSFRVNARCRFSVIYRLHPPPPTCYFHTTKKRCARRRLPTDRVAVVVESLSSVEKLRFNKSSPRRAGYANDPGSLQDFSDGTR